jgi:hypothetical protein
LDIMTDPLNPAPAGAVPPSPQGGTSSRKKRWITPALAIVAALAIGGAGGVLIGRHSASAAAASPAGFARGGFTGGQAGGGPAGAGAGQAGAGPAAGGGFAGLTAGTIVSVNGSTIVVKGQDGTQKTIDTSSTTKVTKSASSSVSALKAGESVTVIGSADSSGNITAKTISEGAATRAGLGRRAGGAGQAATTGSAG